MILICGEALYDMFATDPAADPITFEAHIGGSPYNVAIGLARLGRPVAFFGGVSRDPLGEKLVNRLAGEGVETGHVHRSDALTTLSVVQRTPAGQPAYTFYGEGAADRMVTAANLPDPSEPFSVIHVGSYTALVEPVASAFKALIERERHRCLIAFDPNIRPTVVTDMGRWRHNTDVIADMADLIKVSDEDLGLIEPDTAPADIAMRWVAGGTPLVVVTHGADGAELFTARERIRVEGRNVAVVDTVGAGDTFQAALLFGLTELDIRDRESLAALDADSLRRLVLYAVDASALTCTRRGADLPRKAELKPF